MEYSAKEALELLISKKANRIQDEFGNVVYLDEYDDLHEVLYGIDDDGVYSVYDTNIIDQEYFFGSYKDRTFIAYK